MASSWIMAWCCWNFPRKIQTSVKEMLTEMIKYNDQAPKIKRVDICIFSIGLDFFFQIF